VWQAKRANNFSFDSKEVGGDRLRLTFRAAMNDFGMGQYINMIILQAPKLTEQQWDRLVDNLHRTSKIKERSVHL
jgi:hypothetical protein